MVTFIEGNGRPGTIVKTTKAVNPGGRSIRTSSHVNRNSSTNITNCSTKIINRNSSTNITNSSTKSINRNSSTNNTNRSTHRNSSTNITNSSSSIRVSSTNIVNSSSIRINNSGSHHHHHSTTAGNRGIKATGHPKTVAKHSHLQSNIIKVVVTNVNQTKKTTQHNKKK
nr:hypothetical protein CFP56_12631 [Quercus suber]